MDVALTIAMYVLGGVVGYIVLVNVSYSLTRAVVRAKHDERRRLEDSEQ